MPNRLRPAAPWAKHNLGSAMKRRGHSHQHAFTHLNPLEREGLVLVSRRNMLKASLAGLAGLSLPGLVRQRAQAATTRRSVKGHKSAIFLWMAGGPSPT